MKPLRGKIDESPCFGVIAEFAEASTLLEAIHAARRSGYTEMEAYTPHPLREVWEALGHESRLPALVFCGGLLGAIAGFGMQYFASAVHRPLNVGGRPLDSWPSFIPITFEMTILFAALTAVFGMLLQNGLPRPHHPVFDVPGFESGRHERFFLLLLARDPRFDLEQATSLLSEMEPSSLTEVPSP